MGKRSRRRSEAKSASSGPSTSPGPVPLAGAATGGARSAAGGLGLTLALLAVALAGFLVQAHVLRGPFLYDDVGAILQNANVTDPGRTAALWVSPFFAGIPEMGLYRPVTALSLRADHALFGASATGFHAVNHLLHALVAGLVTLLVVRLGSPLLAGLAAGLLFAVHPVHTEAVSWITGRSEVLAAAFSLLALLAWRRHRATGSVLPLLASAVLWFLALGSKESGAPLPAVLVAGEWLGLFPRREAERAGTGDDAADAMREATGEKPLHRAAGVALRLVPFAVVGAAWAALRVVANGSFGVSTEQSVFRFVGADVRVATALAGVASAARLLVLPIGLRIDYPLDAARTLADPAALAGLAALVATVAAIVLARRAAPRAAFWLAFGALFYLPASNLLLATGSVFAERSLYIPSIGACALAGLLVATLGAGRRRRPAVLAALLAVAGLLALGTWRRNADWADALRFWRTAVAQSPESRKVRSGLADVLWQEGKQRGDAALMDEAIESIRIGLALARPGAPLDSDQVRMLSNRAFLLRERGRAEEARVAFAELLAVFRSTRLLANQTALHATAANALGVLVDETGRKAEALALFEEALRLEPKDPVYHGNAGRALGALGRRTEAAVRFRQALALETDPRSALEWEFYALMGEGRPQDAATLVRPAAGGGDPRALDLHLVAARKMAETRLESDPEGTYAAYRAHVEMARRAGRLRPEVTLAAGWLAERLGRREEALAFYRETLALDPANAQARARAEALGAPAAR